jgi:hypothetical protein
MGQIIFINKLFNHSLVMKKLFSLCFLFLLIGIAASAQTQPQPKKTAGKKTVKSRTVNAVHSQKTRNILKNIKPELRKEDE